MNHNVRFTYDKRHKFNLLKGGCFLWKIILNHLNFRSNWDEWVYSITFHFKGTHIVLFEYEYEYGYGYIDWIYDYVFTFHCQWVNLDTIKLQSYGDGLFICPHSLTCQFECMAWLFGSLPCCDVLAWSHVILTNKNYINVCILLEPIRDSRFETNYVEQYEVQPNIYLILMDVPLHLLPKMLFRDQNEKIDNPLQVWLIKRVEI